MKQYTSALTPEQKRQHVAERRLTADEVQKAVYIDFEGFKEHPPSLVGVLIDGQFEQVVFDQGLSAAARHSKLQALDAKEWARGLLDRVSREQRRVVAFSSHEKTVFQVFFDVNLQPFYADARMIAKSLRKSLNYPPGSPPRDLKSYLLAIGFERGIHLGERKSTARIRAVSDMLAKRGDFDQLTPVVKAKWTKLLDHNRIDVLGMHALVREALKLD